MTLLASPQDRDLARLLSCPTDPITEQYGADVLGGTTDGLIAWQRKTTTDLIASVKDGRLASSVLKLRMVKYPVFIHERNVSFTSDGQVYAKYGSGWTREQIRNLLRSMSYEHGIRTEETTDIQDTAHAIIELLKWMNKAGKGLGPITRGKLLARNQWNVTDKRSWAVFFLQGIDGVGPKRAEAIYEAHKRLPVKWDTTIAELELIVGKVTAERIWKALNG